LKSTCTGYTVVVAHKRFQRDIETNFSLGISEKMIIIFIA
jgi:hypothetical protein